MCQRAAKQGPKQPKTAFFGQKRIWWFQTGGTVWNKGGTSQGTSGVMSWKYFTGQEFLSRGAIKGPQNGLLWWLGAFLRSEPIWANLRVFGPPNVIRWPSWFHNSCDVY